jgi:hypothetical protein
VFRLRAAPHLLGPAVGSLDDVEQPPPHDHGPGRGGRPLEDLGVDRILLDDPGVKLLGVPEAVPGIRARPGHVAVQRHGDVGDHVRRGRLLSAGARSVL